MRKNVQLGEFYNSSTIHYDNRAIQTFTFQTVTDSVKKSDVASGKLPQKNEILLDEKTAKQLEKDSKKVIGKEITLSVQDLDKEKMPVLISMSVRVSGISKQEGSTSLSLETLESAYKENNVDFQPNFITVTVDHTKNIKDVQKQIKKIKVKGKSELIITGIGDILNTILLYINLAMYTLAGISAVSLLVSVIMMIVILYISVSERTKEIGVLRSIGFRRKDIRNLFLNEAVFLGISSAVLGTMFAFVIQTAVNYYSEIYVHYAIVAISFDKIILVFLVSVSMNLVAAFLPSRRAANLDPIEALSVE